MRSFFHLFILSFGVALSAPSQTGAAIQAPLVGLILDAHSQVRPVIGIPGAANLGPAANLDSSIQVLAISPHQDYLLALQGDAQDLIIVRTPTANPVTVVLTPKSGPLKVTFSPRGTALLISPSGAQAAQVWIGLPTSPALAWTADLSSLSPGATALAVSDDGQAVLAAGSSADHVSILLATPDGGSRNLSNVATFGGLAFLPGRLDALVGDAQINQVQLFRGITTQVSATLLADSSKGVATPIDLAGSDDGRTVYIANTNPGGVTILSLDTGLPTNLSCACTPAVLAPLSGASVFRLTDSATGLFWILDGGAIQRIVAIPPDPPSISALQEGSQQ